jgi:chitinase
MLTQLVNEADAVKALRQSSPTNGASVTASNVTVTASLTTNGKIIKKVEFYSEATLLGTRTNTPYSMTWSNVATGSKSVSARAYYGASNTANSSTVNFTVVTPIVAKLSKQGTNLLLIWSGGSGTFQVQSAANLFNAP